MSRYRTSDGTLVSKSTIDQRVRKAKEQKLAQQVEKYGYNFSEKSGHNGSGTRLDCAHIKSVNDCQREGCAELAWDVNNIMILTREEHQEYDKNNIQSPII